MVKTNVYRFNNIFAFFLLLLLFGCGNTLSKSEKMVEVLNKNSVIEVKEFKFTKLQNIVAFDGLPEEFAVYKNQMERFDFYLAQSPTQHSGGFNFEVVQNSNPLMFCLRKPSPMSIVTASLTNPIALIKVSKNYPVKSTLSYCD